VGDRRSTLYDEPSRSSLLASAATAHAECAWDARLWHPWLRINRVLGAMLHERWSAEAWPQVKAEFKRALALRSQIRGRGGSTEAVRLPETGLAVFEHRLDRPASRVDDDRTLGVTV
jgi:hypothetical protein